MKNLIVIAILFLSFTVSAQGGKNKYSIDTTITDYDALFSELDNLLDAIARPKSFVLANLEVANDYFHFKADSATAVNKIVWAPSLSYFHKSGLGISGETDIVNDGQKLNAYQFTLTGFYDYYKNRNFITGISLSHYFTKSDLNFYTSPLLNDVQAYFTYRKFRVRPSISFRYGWGSQQAYTEQQESIHNLTVNRNITTQENISDLNITTSVKYIFYLDDLKFTPQLSFVNGTQQFGFNQVSNIYTSRGHSGKDLSLNTENLVLTNGLDFQQLSLTALLKTEYSKKNFFLQPQVLLQYYFPASQNNLTAGFIINTGFIF